MNLQPEYLGIPSNENEWLKYKGQCIIFAGLSEKINEDGCSEGWIMESEEKTKERLIKGLESVGVKCENISFKWCDIKEGQRSCECICYYNKPYQIYNSEFFITGLTSFYFDAENINSQLEFIFTERL